MMTYEETQVVKNQIKVLKELQEDYGHKTLNNVLDGLEKRIKEFGNDKLTDIQINFV